MTNDDIYIRILVPVVVYAGLHLLYSLARFGSVRRRSGRLDGAGDRLAEARRRKQEALQRERT